MTKIAYSTKTLEALRQWAEESDEAQTTTRYLPRRHEEMVGGSLYWIMDHTIVARNQILGFTQSASGRWIIHLEPKLVLVEPLPKRAHQGWRYLEAENAPPDLPENTATGDILPLSLIRELTRLGLL